MTICEQNIINRWNLMASKDLGVMVNPQAEEFCKLFKKVFEEQSTQFSTDCFKNILPILRGFQVNLGWLDLNFSVCETLGLDYINIDKESAKELDDYLMQEIGWYSRYEYALSI